MFSIGYRTENFKKIREVQELIWFMLRHKRLLKDILEEKVETVKMRKNPVVEYFPKK